MAVPAVVGTPALVDANASALPTFTVPSGAANNDYLVAVIGNQDTAASADYTNDGGMVRIGAPFATGTTATRTFGIYGLAVPVASSLPSTITFSRSGSGTRQVGIMFLVRGDGSGIEVDAAASSLNTTGTNTCVATGLTATGNDRLAIAGFLTNWASPQDSSVSSVSSPLTQVALRQNPNPGSSSVSRTQVAVYAGEIDTGASGDKTLTFVGTPAQHSGQMVLLRNAATNVPPVANAGSDQSLGPGVTCTLNGTGSTDSDGTITGYLWTQTGGPTVTLSSSTVASPTFTTPTIYGGTTLTFQLQVTDSGGATNTDTMQVTVSTGPDTLSYVGFGAVALVTASGAPAYPSLAAGDRLWMSATSDVNVQPANPSGWGTGTTVAGAGGMWVTQWTKTATGSETGTVALTGFTGGTKGIASITAVRSASGATPSIQMASGGDSDSTSTAVSATGPSWTVLTGDILLASATMKTSTGTYSGVMTGLSLSNAGVTDTDTTRFNSTASSNTLSYSQVSSAVTSGGTGAPTFTATTVTASSATASGMVAFARVSLGATNVPPVANAGPDQSVNPNDIVTLTGAASTDTEGPISTYAWSQTAGPTVTLSSTSVVSPTFTAPTVPGGTSLTFQLTVPDSAGASHSDTVTITVAAPSPGVYWQGQSVVQLMTTGASMSLPPGTAVGDETLVYCFSNSSTDPVDPTGFTQLGPLATSGGVSVTVWHRVIDGSESGTITLTGVTGGTKGVAYAVTYRPSSACTVSLLTAGDIDSTSTTVSMTAGSTFPIDSGDMVAAGICMFAASGAFTNGFATPVVNLSTVTEVSSIRFSARASSDTVSYGHFDAKATSSGGSVPSFTATSVGANGTGIAAFVRLTVTASNTPPIANAGSDQSVLPDVTVTLDGTASSDPGGSIASYQWSQLSGPTVTLSSSTVASPTFTSPMPLGDATLVFQLLVTDNLGATATDTVNVVVTSHTNFYFNGSDWRPIKVVTLP